jgi:hypothetical protein
MSRHILFVTCTYKRPGRIAFLRRHVDRLFSRISNYTWILVEDAAATDPDVAVLLAGLNAIYLNAGPTLDKGNIQRNLAYETIRDRRIDGVVYNMDDDNLVYETLCPELRKVSRFAVFPVGNLGPGGIERPVVADGRILGWMAGWAERAFPIDMGGFAFPSRILFDLPSPVWSHTGIGGESEFIARFVRSADELDASLCHYNKMCLVYHNEPLDSPVLVG